MRGLSPERLGLLQDPSGMIGAGLSGPCSATYQQWREIAIRHSLFRSAYRTGAACGLLPRISGSNTDLAANWARAAANLLLTEDCLSKF